MTGTCLIHKGRIKVGMDFCRLAEGWETMPEPSESQYWITAKDWNVIQMSSIDGC